MSRISLFNLAIGFLVLFIAACYGAFIATDLTSDFIHDPALLNSWSTKITQSSHGHTNLFGILHIAFGLTLPYSIWPNRIKIMQTIGLAAGTIAMGPLMLIKSSIPPHQDYDVASMAIGIFLSFALCAILTQSVGIFARILRRS